MKIPLALAVAIGVSAWGQPGAAQDRAAPQTVQIDLNKLPADVVKRLLDELAKQAQPAVAEMAAKKPKKDDNREVEKPKGSGEKPAKRKPGEKKERDEEKEREKKEREKEAERGK